LLSPSSEKKLDMVSLTGLSQAFGNTSNPQYLMPFHSHAAALRLLSEAPKEGRNIRVLVGEPGVGKTMLLLHLLERFRPSALTSHLFWTQLGRGEFLGYFLHQLGISRPAVDIGEAQKQLSAVLEREFRQGRRVIVAIDEGHNLEVAALRGLAELLDCSIARTRDLQVVLAGLPRMTGKLSARELRGLSERISEVTSLSPLTADETASYIRRRLEFSGYNGAIPFTPDAIATIANLSEGIPRNINNICSAGLFLAAKRPGTAIDSSTIVEADAQWGGRPVMQETAPEVMPWPRKLVAAEAKNQQAPPSPELPISSTGPPQPLRFQESAANARTQAGPSGEPEGSQLMADRIRQWFEKRLGWSGTVGELAVALEQPETEVEQALNASSDILRSFGIAASMRQSVGRTRSVSLRRVEKPRSTNTELSNPDSSREAESETIPNLTAATRTAENPCGDAQASRQNVVEMPSESAQEEAAAVSPVDQLLGLVRANEQRRAGAHASRFRRIFSGLLILLVMIAVAIGWTYGPVAIEKGHFWSGHNNSLSPSGPAKQ
jgi:type II secretory pathway predicted ATPase ExeA